MDRAARMNMWIINWEKTSQQTGYVPIFLKSVLFVLSLSFQRRVRQLSSESDSESANETGRRRLSRTKGSPSASATQGQLKRKATNVSESSPPPKKKKPSDAVDDPARKYCLGKLEELFRDVFLRYPHVRFETTDEDMDVNDSKESKIIPKKIEELNEKEMEALINEAKQFAQDLESCVYDIYSEPDKQGNVHAGGKYKYVALSFPRLLSVQLTFLVNV